MITVLLGFANAALACPEEVAEATTVLEARRAEHLAAKQVVRGTDWEYYLALDDRDAVLARQAAAEEQLRTSRVALREAKRQLRTVQNAGPTDLVCDPNEPVDTTAG